MDVLPEQVLVVKGVWHSFVTQNDGSRRNEEFMKKQSIIFIIMAFAFSACGQEYNTFDEMALDLSKGSAPKIEATTLNKANASSIIYLDAREKEEFDVGHIKGAIHIGYDNFELSNLPSIKKGETIIVYCSVGYRSEKIAEQLIQNGFSQTKNLLGGIFGWINSGYPVYDNEDRETQQIHGYSESWGKWLVKGEKVYE